VFFPNKDAFIHMVRSANQVIYSKEMMYNSWVWVDSTSSSCWYCYEAVVHYCYFDLFATFTNEQAFASRQNFYGTNLRTYGLGLESPRRWPWELFFASVHQPQIQVQILLVLK